MSATYIMREKRKKSKLPYIILFALYLMMSAFLAYSYISYKILNGITKDDFIVFFKSFGMIGSANNFLAPLTLETAKEIFRLNFMSSGICLHLITFLLSLMMFGKKDHNEFKNVEYGSADWATEKDEAYFKDTSGIPIAKDFYVSLDEKEIKVKGYGNIKQAKLNNLNQLVVASSGMGKTFRTVEPQIMNMTGNYVVTDPKGELFRNCAKMLKKNNYDIKVLNLYDITCSNKYNPFAYITTEQDVVKIGNIFMKASAGNDDKQDFWVASSEMIFTGILGYLFLTDGERKSFGRAAELLTSVRYKKGALDITCDYGKCMEAHLQEKPNDMVSLIYKAVKGTVEQTLSGQIATLQTRLKLWLTKDVIDLTDTDEMDFDSFADKNKKQAIFIITPSADTTYSTVVTMFYSQLFDRLQWIANYKCNGRLPTLVSVLMDEFANCQQIKDFEKILSVVRSYNIAIMIVLQGLSQLKSLYKNQYETIINNCAIFVYLGSEDEETTKYISNRLDKTTVRISTRSYNRGNNGGGSDSENYTSRSLLTQHEVSAFASNRKGKYAKYDGRCIVFVTGFKPFGLCKYDTLSHPNAHLLGSSFKKDWHNNTDIVEYFAELRKNETKAPTGKGTVTDGEAAPTEEDSQEQGNLKKEFECLDSGCEVDTVEIEDITEDDLTTEYYEEFADTESDEVLKEYEEELAKKGESNG